jgi:1-acyl-sn-glycerol-3-phosphate acyltransferase
VVLNTLIFGPIVTLVCLFERDGKVGYRIAKAWIAVNLWLSGVRVSVRGRENLDPSRSYVFMSNHRSNTDIIALGWALWEYQLRWVAKKELLKVPVFGWGLKALKNIVIDRTNHAEAVRTYAAAGERMRRGISVIVFPEGTRGLGDELLPFKKGGFLLAIETGTPIVPIGILGTAAVLPRNGWQVESGEVELRIGKPIETAGLTVEDRNRLVARVRQEIHGLMTAAASVDRPRAAGRP